MYPPIFFNTAASCWAVRFVLNNQNLLILHHMHQTD